jgi:hypothetical protein
MPNRPRLLLTWRILLMAYILPLALVWGGFVLVLEQRNDDARAFEQASIARDEMAKDREIEDCLKSRLNAQVNLDQNRRLETLLDAAVAMGDGDGGLFRQAVAAVKAEMRAENRALYITTQAQCVRRGNP